MMKKLLVLVSFFLLTSLSAMEGEMIDAPSFQIMLKKRRYDDTIIFLQKNKDKLLAEKDDAYKNKKNWITHIFDKYLPDKDFDDSRVELLDGFLAAGLDVDYCLDEEFSSPNYTFLCHVLLSKEEVAACLLMEYGARLDSLGFGSIAYTDTPVSITAQQIAIQNRLLGVLQYLVDNKKFNPNAKYNNYKEYSVLGYALLRDRWLKDTSQKEKNESQKVITFLKQHGCTE